MSEKMTASELVARAKNDFDAVHAAGYAEGKLENIDYDRFWDNFQNNGQPTVYNGAFAHNRFDNETYNPKYPIVCDGADSTNARHMFFNNTKITDTKVPIDVTAMTAAGVLTQTFSCFGSGKVSALETINELRVTPATDYSNTFMNATALKDITIVGPIINEETGERLESPICNSISFAWSGMLSKESILNIYNALSTNISTKPTVTFKESAINNNFGGIASDEWKALEDAKKQWWTFAYA